MKPSISALVTTTAAAVLFFVGTGMAHADKGGSKGGPSGGPAKMSAGQSPKSNFNVAKTNVVNNNKFSQQHFKSTNFCNTWNKGCYPWFWNSCWSYPWYNRCYSYPVYDTCYTTPLVYAYQVPVVTTRVVEVVKPAPVVETITTTSTATIIKPRVYHFGSVFHP
ncbi:MAG: hypothetical protein QM703_16115 [Gemmatales bacterium]